MLTKKFSPKRSAKASLQFDAKCYNCNFDNTLYLELDHYEALANGGERAQSTLMPLCSKCNKAKGSKTAMDFYGNIEVIADIERRFALVFTDTEIFSEMQRLIEIERTYVKGSKAVSHSVSESVKRASLIKG